MLDTVERSLSQILWKVTIDMKTILPQKMNFSLTFIQYNRLQTQSWGGKNCRLALSRGEADRRSNYIHCGTITETRMTSQKLFLLVVVGRARASSEPGKISVLELYSVMAGGSCELDSI